MDGTENHNFKQDNPDSHFLFIQNLYLNIYMYLILHILNIYVNESNYKSDYEESREQEGVTWELEIKCIVCFL